MMHNGNFYWGNTGGYIPLDTIHEEKLNKLTNWLSKTHPDVLAQYQAMVAIEEDNDGV